WLAPSPARGQGRSRRGRRPAGRLWLPRRSLGVRVVGPGPEPCASTPPEVNKGTLDSPRDRGASHGRAVGLQPAPLGTNAGRSGRKLTAAAAAARVDEFTQSYGQRLPAVIKPWRSSWSDVIRFLGVLPELGHDRGS